MPLEVADYTEVARDVIVQVQQQAAREGKGRTASAIDLYQRLGQMAGPSAVRAVSRCDADVMIVLRAACVVAGREGDASAVRCRHVAVAAAEAAGLPSLDLCALDEAEDRLEKRRLAEIDATAAASLRTALRHFDDETATVAAETVRRLG